MKKNSLVSVLAGGVLLAACSKQEQTSAPAPSAPPPPTPAARVDTAEKAVSTAPAEQQNLAAAGQKAVESAAKEATQAVETVKAPEAVPAAVPAATPTTQVNVQGILDEAKSQLSQKKYADALTTLSQLSNVNLSAEQQRLVEQLKAQVQKAMVSENANEGLKSVGGLLKK